MGDDALGDFLRVILFRGTHVARAQSKEKDRNLIFTSETNKVDVYKLLNNIIFKLGLKACDEC